MTPTLRDERTTRPWRARAFVRQPLVTTIIGVVVSIVLYVVVYNVTLRPDCVADNYACQYYVMGHVLDTFPVLLVGVLITGLVVGLGSHASGPALRAVVAAVMVPLLIYGVALVLPDTFARSALTQPWKPTFGDYVMTTVGGLAFGAVVGLVALVPAALGFGVGRLVRKKFRQ